MYWNFVAELLSDIYRYIKIKGTTGAALFDLAGNTFARFTVDVRMSIMHIESIAITESFPYINTIGHDKFLI